MKFLLNNELAPLTFTWRFPECPVTKVVDSYVRWQRKILHSARVESIDLSLVEALRKLEPLDMDMHSSVVLFLSTKSSWTACFDNGVKGGNATTFVGYLCEVLRCRGLVCREFLNIERDISLTNDISGWGFRATGSPQPFEQSDRYLARQKADRFTSEMLEEYCRALGIDLFHEDCYGGAGAIIRSRFWFLPGPKGSSLRGAQMSLGMGSGSS